MNLYKKISTILNECPKVCITLGSGLHTFIEKLTNKKTLPYSKIDNFHKTNVKGHKGEFVFGYINNIPVLCASGRFHYYEGFSFEEIGVFQNLFKNFNPKLNIITNSSGCLNPKWKLGSFMVAERFLDFSFLNSNKPIYYKANHNIITYLKNIKNINTGTYTFTLGPTYETESEIKEIQQLGGSAVGMSTFPEFIQSKKIDLNSIVISCLTNYGAGIKAEKVEHKDVIKNAGLAQKEFGDLIVKIIIENM